MALSRSVSSAPPPPSWNPIDCRGTELREPELLAAKLLLLFAVAGGNIHWAPNVFAPLLPGLEVLPARPLLWGGQAVFAMAGVSLLLNRSVRLASFTLGAVILLTILASRVAYQNNALAVAFGLMLLGLQERGRVRWMLRCQLSLMFLGAGLNKAFEPDWRSGQFIDFWLGTDVASPLYAALLDALPSLPVGQWLGWAAIASELSLGMLFALPSLRRVAIPLAISFHVALLLLSAFEVSWIFLYITPVLCLSITEWQPVKSRPRWQRPILYFVAASVYLVALEMLR